MKLEFIYQSIYLAIGTLILFSVLNKSQLPDNSVNKATNTSPLCLVLVVILTLFVGFRPVQVGADTTQYFQQYYWLDGKSFELVQNAENPLFDNFMAFARSYGFDISAVFIPMALIYFGGMYLACKKLFSNNQKIAFVTCLVAFSTFAYGVNGMKAGAAGSLFLVALAYREKKWLSIGLTLFTVGIHHSMVVVAYAYIISYFYRNTKMYFYGWILALFIATAHITVFQTLFMNYADDKGKEYLMGDGFMTGFRPDFILYSAMPVFVGYYMLFKKKIVNDVYELWLRMYLTTNSVWMLCMYASYTNRIAYLSWFMYPIVLIMPYYAIYTSDNQLITGRKVVLYHLYFTLFMTFFYNGLR